RQLQTLSRGVDIVVATPGRAIDHLKRGSLDLTDVEIVVLDEADEMLDMGFVEDIEFILDAVPTERQIGLFSATMPGRIESLAKRYLREPVRVTIAQETRTAPQTRQFYYETPYRGKLEALALILDFEAPQSAIIFCRTRREVDELSGALQARGYSTATIHGDISQGQREKQLRAFREGHVDLLVATDVAARGLDIPDVSHVINYDIPDDADAYVHRVGRTGRAGKSGEAITLVTPRERRLLGMIEQQIRKKMKQMHLPTQSDIAARRREAFVGALRDTIEAGEGEPYAGLISELGGAFTPEAVAAAAVHLAYTGSSGRNEPPWADTDLIPAPTSSPIRRDADERREIETPGDDANAGLGATEHGMTRLFLDAGRKAGLRPQDIVGAFTGEAGIAGPAIGSIDLYDKFTFVEVKPSAAKKVMEHTATFTVRGVEIHVKPAVPQSGLVAGKRKPGRKAERHRAGPGHKN
ncbi:MAG: DEAD/DEAH box helicase, partial [Tepidiformaceae bacterium]